MQTLIAQDFGGIGMWCHRDDLIRHLGHVEGQLDRGLEHFKQHDPWVYEEDIRLRKVQYGRMKNVLLEVDKRAMETLTRAPPS
jgi:hypothetical protein